MADGFAGKNCSAHELEQETIHVIITGTPFLWPMGAPPASSRAPLIAIWYMILKGKEGGVEKGYWIVGIA